MLDQAAEALYAGDCEHAIAVCEQAAKLGDDAAYHAALLRGDALLQLGQRQAGLEVFEALQPENQDGLDPQVCAARAGALYELLRLEEAAAQAEAVLDAVPDFAEAYYLLGLVRELQGHLDADALFAQAHALDPERCPKDRPIPDDVFQHEVEQALASLPEAVSAAVATIPVLVEEVPDPTVLAQLEPPMSPTLLGLFVGTPPSQQSVLDPVADPARILLFKRNLERAFAERGQLREQIALTVIHEVGHALGLNEDELVSRGLE